MKRMICLIAVLGLASSLCACAQNAGEASPLPAAAAVYTGVVIAAEPAQLVVAGALGRADSADLFILSTEGLVTDAANGFAPGDLVEIGYSGSINETYPSTFADPVYLRAAGKSGSPLSMYLELLRALYEDDAGLNDNITYLAFDLDNCVNLTPAERAAAAWLIAGEYGLEPLTGSFGELAEQGYVNKDDLYFPDGVILKITDTEAQNGSFTFSASKWRGGDGAVGMDDCIAKENNGLWTYEKGAMWIS